MKSLLQLFSVALFAAFLLTACGKSFYPATISNHYYSINSNELVDSAIIHYIKPYRDSLKNEMREVIATSAMTLPKAKPESLMGNLIADLVLEKGKQYFEEGADFSVVNYGGLRIPAIPAGEITTGTVFELMPFDNYLVLMEIKGTVVQQLADVIAANGGWPVSGINFTIKNEKALQISLNNIPLLPEKIYRVLISDYLADGGDNLFFLKNEQRKNSGILLRDVILEFFKEKTKEGKVISSKLDNRIIVQ